ncbi:DNA adenine methylase, partial [Campylobacter upsaliensis]
MFKEYKAPPLAFNGNKRKMLKLFREALEDMKCYVNKDTIFYDVFGGSGLLAHETKRQFQNNEVIWNDFDNFQGRLDMLDKTEALRLKIINILKKESTGRDKPFSKEIRAEVESLLKEEGNFDYIQLSSWLRFTGSYAKSCEDFFRTKEFYNKFNYGKVLDKKDYLKGVIRVQKDYRKLIKEAKERGNFFFILDPPYIQTDKAHYEGFFGMKEFLELIINVKMPFIFFSSAKSEILNFIDFC